MYAHGASSLLLNSIYDEKLFGHTLAHRAMDMMQQVPVRVALTRKTLLLVREAH